MPDTEGTQPLPPLAKALAEGGDTEVTYASPDGWSPTEVVRRSGERLSYPQGVSAPDGRHHILWVEDGWIWHTWRVADGWAEPQRLFMGHQISLDVDAEGTLHLAFAHEFGGRHQIYYTRYVEPMWALPYEISRTPGVSHRPHLRVGASGLVYVVWEDDTPGFPAVYHAYNPDGHWINAPVPGVRGWRPVLAAGAESLHLVWENTLPTGEGDDVYHAQMGGSGWSLAENISDSPTADSALPRVALAPNEDVHVVWQERVGNRSAIGYAYGRYASWRKPLALTVGGHPQEPGIAIARQGHIHVVWVDGPVLAYRGRSAAEETAWDAPQAVDRVEEGEGGPAFPSLWVDDGGNTHLLWVRREGDEHVLCYRYRETPMQSTQYMPFVSVP